MLLERLLIKSQERRGKKMKRPELLGSRRLPDGDEAIKVMKWSKPNFKKAFAVSYGNKTYRPQEFVSKYPKYIRYSEQDVKMIKKIENKATGRTVHKSSNLGLGSLLGLKSTKSKPKKSTGLGLAKLFPF